MTTQFPFSAIVGQDEMVEALLINAVDPTVGGVLVRGERGTAKSTAVRALAPLLPPVMAAASEPFAFAPGELSPGGVVDEGAEVADRPATLVELPLGATLDRLLGSIDLSRALAGDHAFEAGLLARAHRGILYVDEVNLLPDHLVDALLDAAASGVAVVEREAISVGHDARFLLVGTMNPEEGELRPQLLDRFGLAVTVRAPKNPDTRAEIVRRRLAYEADPEGFAARYADAERKLSQKLVAARERLPRVVLPERELNRIVIACTKLNIDGVRGDIVCARAARVLAALEGIDRVQGRHVRRAARLAFAHRLRRDPLDKGTANMRDLDKALDDDGPEDEPPNGGGVPSEYDEYDDDGALSDAPSEDEIGLFRPGPGKPIPLIEARLPDGALKLQGRGLGPAGRGARSRGPAAGAVDSRPALPESEDLSIVASLRDKIVNGVDSVLHEHIRSGRESALLCLVIDTSGSMSTASRLAAIKGALLQVLREAYVRRDRVAIITFRDYEAKVLVEPGAPIERAAAEIQSLATGGTTPIAEGLACAAQLIELERTRSPNRRAVAVVMTDGTISGTLEKIFEHARRLGAVASAVHVVDVDEGPLLMDFTRTLAEATGGQLHTLVRSRKNRRRTA